MNNKFLCFIRVVISESVLLNEVYQEIQTFKIKIPYYMNLYQGFTKAYARTNVVNGSQGC